MIKSAPTKKVATGVMEDPIIISDDESPALEQSPAAHPNSKETPAAEAQTASETTPAADEATPAPEAVPAAEATAPLEVHVETETKPTGTADDPVIVSDDDEASPFITHWCPSDEDEVPLPWYVSDSGSTCSGSDDDNGLSWHRLLPKRRRLFRFF